MLGLTSVISKFHLLSHHLHPSLPPSYVAVRHLSPHSSHGKSCMGLSVLLMLDMKLRSRLVSEDITQIRSFFHKNHLWRLKCHFPQESSEISVQTWPVFWTGQVRHDLECVFWKWGCCWNVYWSADLQSCITTGVDVTLMCRRECFHNRIKEDSNLDLTDLTQCSVFCFFWWWTVSEMSPVLHK